MQLAVFEVYSNLHGNYEAVPSWEDFTMDQSRPIVRGNASKEFSFGLEPRLGNAWLISIRHRLSPIAVFPN